MPDWSYRPIFRPLLFRLPAARARNLTLGAMGTLAGLPLGRGLIDFLGQMRPAADLGRIVAGIHFPAPVGLGAGLDVNGVALPALARFGFGFLEVGPVTEYPVAGLRPIERRVPDEALVYPEPLANPGLSVWMARLETARRLGVPLGIRLGHDRDATGDEASRERRLLVERLGRFADFFTLDTRGGATDGTWSAGDWDAHLREVLGAVRIYSPPGVLLVCLAPDLGDADVDRLLGPALGLGLQGAMITGGMATSLGRLTGRPTREASLERVRRVRARFGDDLVLIGSGGICEPADALRMLEAGASLVQVHGGLVYSGPGLAKRINEAVAWSRPRPAERSVRTGWGWVWTALVGAGLIVGGVLALVVAATRVVLPYDEAFVGMTRAQLAGFNPRLLLFMAHDRVTLAGTMVSLGVLYGQCAVFGLRTGQRWARRAVLLSAAVGFPSFFLFVGFGYFDPLHALATLILFAFFLLGLLVPTPIPCLPSAPDLTNDRAWRLALWGQLLLVAEGIGLTIAGLVIAGVGVTRVFVPEDLEFLQTTAAALQQTNPRLLPLIAHDRAGFGGALASCGVLVLLAALWGFRPGARWLWWGLLGACLPGYTAALAVHYAIGYTDLWHLAPAFVGALVYVVGLALSYPFLCRATRSIPVKVEVAA